MLHDPAFYVTAIIAVMIVGIAKGGLGSGVGIVGVPLMALTIAPARAAAIMLPILLTMDLFAMRAWWGRWDRENLRTMIPGGVLGTLIGWATFRMLSADALRLLVGALAFGLSLAWFLRRTEPARKPPSLARGTFWSTLAGFTSFSIHAGGPPTQVYLLSQQLDKGRFQGTTVAFFFMLNWLKAPMFAWLGQLDFDNLATSLVLLPLAPLGIWIGRTLHDRVDERLFYRIIYASLLLIGAKLIYDAV
ncbi:MAG TPA: sulfite exporter TauE/SafE family protein [Pseudomonadales bacterium]|nr:sulfite exporter TauE/SafE family protein [Pseudomonadales bacterium]